MLIITRILLILFVLEFSYQIKGDPLQENEIYRLSNNTTPTEYLIDINANVDDNTFTGTVRIKLVSNIQTDQITINTKLCEIKEIMLAVTSTGEILQTNFVVNNITDILYIKLNKNLRVEEMYELAIKYSSKLRDDKLGFYRASYINEDKKKIWLAATQFSPVHARHAFPCYDEPRFKATFNIRLTYSRKYYALSNMDVLEVLHNDDGKTKTTTFKQTPRMSTYLVGFVISNFDKITTKRDKRFVHELYARKNIMKYTDFTEEYASNAYGKLLDYFNSAPPQPIETMKQVLLPEFHFTGMENWGMVTYKESSLIYNETLHSANHLLGLMYVIGHEMSHHYFGNLVTPEWWSSVWIKEGFSTMYGYYIMNMLHPDWNIMEYYQSNVVQYVFKIDENESIRAMNHYIETQKDIRNNFDRIAYEKSSCVLRMFDQAIKTEIFKKGMVKYLTEMKMKSAKEENIFENLEQALKESGSKLNITKTLGSWTSQAGFPLLTIDTRSKVIHLEQGRFPNKGSSDSSIWSIPVNFEVPNGHNFSDTAVKFWMETEEGNFTISNDINWNPGRDWIIFNVQQTGYYRVNYDLKNWELIIKTLLTDHKKIHVQNRAQLIDDAFALVEANKLSYNILLNLLQYLKSETSFAPWNAFDRGIKFLGINLARSDANKNFRKFMNNLLSPALSEFGLTKISQESPLQSITRSIIIKHSCNFELKGCVSPVKDFNSPDTRTTFYCNKLRLKNKETYFEMLDIIKNTEIATIRSDLIKALGCFENKYALELLLLYTIQDTHDIKLSSAEKLILFRSIFENTLSGFERSLIFLDENWKSIYSSLESGNFDNLVFEISVYAQKNEEIQTIHNILSKTSITTADKVKKNLIKTYDWKLRHSAIVEDWLKKNYADASDNQKGSSPSIKHFSFAIILIPLVLSALNKVFY